MKKILILLFSLLLAALALPAQEIRNIDETVVIRPDGSAQITQIWDVNVVSGTEFYLPFDHLGPIEITDLRVSENGEEFVAEGDGWDTDRSREQKRGRCGIVRKKHGVELCWGQGDYGDHVWTVRYTVSGMVMKMGDYNGLYFSFVNPGLSAPPQHVKVMLVNETGGPDWTEENVKVWGFRSESEIFVEDGAVRAESLEPFRSSSAMTVLVRFDPDLLTPAVEYDKGFEDIIQLAFKGSDYKDKTTFGDVVVWILVILGLLLLTPVGWIILALIIFLVAAFNYHILGWKFNKKIFGARRIKGWYRDVPLKGSIPAGYYVLSKGDSMTDWGKDCSNRLIGAYFLRWVLAGVVEVLPDPENKNRVNLSFKQQTSFKEVLENDLYTMAREASGKNLILEAGELDKWSKKSFKRMSDLPSRAQTLGRKWFEDRHYTEKSDRLNKEGQEQARHLIEFKNFLEDFTLNKQRGAIEVTLWEDYLVFAELFGIADKVAKQFEKLYPTDFAKLSRALNGASLYTVMSYSNSISASALRNARVTKTWSDSGSSSSSSGSSSHRSYGGGGHFSSGGGHHSFGGSRGGGSR
ncbi:MAG: DUF2207 domain-containing protein [Bacteroidales bacterium]|nr:DUF2207 domain-containing protein [Bacteroidales bacterium]